MLEVEVWEHLARLPQVVGEVGVEEEMVAHPKQVHWLVELVSNLLLTWAPKALELQHQSIPRLPAGPSGCSNWQFSLIR